MLLPALKGIVPERKLVKEFPYPQLRAESKGRQGVGCLSKTRRCLQVLRQSPEVWETGFRCD